MQLFREMGHLEVRGIIAAKIIADVFPQDSLWEVYYNMSQNPILFWAPILLEVRICMLRCTLARIHNVL